MEQRYNWKTSKALFDIFRALTLQEESKSVSEIATFMDKDLRSISEQIGYLEKDGIITTEKIGRTKYVDLNLKWMEKYYPKLLPINTLEWNYLFYFNTFEELDKNLEKQDPPRQKGKKDFNDYYKSLKNEEPDIKKLKNRTYSLITSYIVHQIMINKLRKENKMLREELNKYKEWKK